MNTELEWATKKDALGHIGRVILFAAFAVVDATLLATRLYVAKARDANPIGTTKPGRDFCLRQWVGSEASQTFFHTAIPQELSFLRNSLLLDLSSEVHAVLAKGVQ